jgi:hypothetical protein
MDKIFAEIKRAIEEEMANQEVNRPGGGPRPSGPSGRDAERYQAWLREEQDRLRGARTEPVPEVEVREERPRDGRQRRQPQDGRERDRARQRRQERPRQREEREGREAQELAPVERRDRATLHDRSEARHERRLRSAYEQRGGRTVVRSEISESSRSRQGIRKAFLLREIVGRPVSLRSQDEHLIS